MAIWWVFGARALMVFAVILVPAGSHWLLALVIPLSDVFIWPWNLIPVGL